VSSVDETERQLEAWLEERARPMPQYVLESSIEAIARTSQVSPDGLLGIRWLNRPMIAIGVAFALLVVAVTTGPSLLDRFGRAGSGGIGPPSCEPPPAGLVGWWPGDGVTEDVVGDRDAELIGGAKFAPGTVGEGFGLDGQDDFVDVADDPALDVGRRDFSVALWVWFDVTDGEQVLVEKWVQGIGVASGWTLTKLETNALGLFTEDGVGGGHGALTDPLELPARTWVHIAGRRVGGAVDLFLNGERVATATDPAAILDLDTDASLKFGHRGAPGDTPGSEDPNGYFLDGVVDEVLFVVGRAMTDGEVTAIHGAGTAGSCKP
jgi:hypothetical protein